LYADKEFEVKKQALSFSNPMGYHINGGTLDGKREVFNCLFSKDFFQQFPNFSNTKYFKPMEHI